jgi:hypothetical protein
MSVLPSGQPLQQYLPDLDDFLYDPAGYLGAAPVTIGPRKMYGLAALFGLPGAALVLWGVTRGQVEGEALVLGIGLLLGASVWLGWSLLMRGHALVLHPNGVELKYRDTSVWCPWALFNVEGEPFVPDSDSPRAGLTLPVSAEAVPFVELRRNEAPVAFGAQVKGPQFQFTSPQEIVLPARYEVMARDLGALLLKLGGRLGRQLPRGAPPREAYQTEELGTGIAGEPDEAGWLTAYLTRLRFPHVCCNCGAPTQAQMAVYVNPRWDWLLSFATSAARPLLLPVPVCETCQQVIRGQQYRGANLGMFLGAAAALAAALAVAWQNEVKDTNALLLVGMGGVASGGLVGFLFGTRFSRRLPVRVRSYSPSRGTLSIHFRQPGYATLVAAAMRDQARSQT